ncbi:hypothetical protein TrRE_jg13634, partial [Triparma retinervis]
MTITPLPNIPNTPSLTLYPLTPGDWEAVEMNVDAFEGGLLQLYSVMFLGQVVSVNVGAGVVVSLSVKCWSPGQGTHNSKGGGGGEAVKIGEGTEIVVEPNVRGGESGTNDTIGPVRVVPSMDDYTGAETLYRGGDKVWLKEYGEEEEWGVDYKDGNVKLPPAWNVGNGKGEVEKGKGGGKKAEDYVPKLEKVVAGWTPRRKGGAVGKVQKETLKEIVKGIKNGGFGVLEGKKGTGKTFLVENALMKLRIEEDWAGFRVDFQDLQLRFQNLNALLGELTRLARVAASVAPCVVVWDGVDLLAPEVDEGDKQLMNLSGVVEQGGVVGEHLLWIIEGMKGRGVSVVAVGRGGIWKGLTAEGRVGWTVRTGLGEGGDRVAVFRQIMKAEGIEGEVREREFVKGTEGCGAGDLCRLVEGARVMGKLRVLGRFGKDGGGGTGGGG